LIYATVIATPKPGEETTEVVVSLTEIALGGGIIVAILIEESMRAWLAAHPDLREQVTEQGVARFFAALGPAAPPAPDQLERALAAAHEAVFAGVTADAVLDSLPTPPADAGAREALRSSWPSLSPAWTLPAPPAVRGLPAPRLALVAALGRKG
jgi:hypothetical protein